MSRRPTRSEWCLAAAVVAVTLSAIAWAHVPAPLPWIWGAWGAFLVAVAAVGPPARGRGPVLLVGLIAVGLGAAEGVLDTVRPPARSEYEPSEPHPWQPDDLLGYAPPSDHHWVHRRSRAGEVLFAASVTTGRDGLRITPRAAPDAHGSILLLGDSFTFGGAVDDSESLAWQLGCRVQDRYQVHCIAFDGWGPHQVLAAIESGRVAEVASLRPTVAVYQLLVDHPLRAAGRVLWDRHGPRYRLADDGTPVLSGSFDGPLLSWQRLVDPVASFLERSALVRAWWSRRRQPSPGEIELTAAMLARSRELLQADWPDVEFVVVLWPWHEPTSSELRRAVDGRGIRTILVGELLPTAESFADAWLVPGDGHPSAACYREMAAALAERLPLED